MKHSRLVFTVVLAALGTWAALASACDKSKGASAANASTAGSAKVCTADMAKNCTPEMAAACQSAKIVALKGQTVSMESCCSGKSAKTSSASATSVAPVGKVNAMAVGYDGTAKSASAAEGVCPHGMASVATGASCPAHGGAAAMAAGSSCSAHGSTVKATGHNCDACADLAMCEEEIRASGANVQIVPLKNGVMYVYAAEGPAKVQAVQAAMARRTDRVAAILAAGDKATLCPDCKSVRGAMASGKLTRETVNIEGGCLTLMTSNDPALVAKIHEMAGVKTLARAKS